jgi:methylglutaconyl-CoA hydratase
MSDSLRTELRRGRLDLILSRPRRRNALDEGLVAELAAALRQAATDDGVRCVVLSGEGKVFCAGADLDAMRRSAAADEAANLRDAEALGELFRAVYECSRPVVARVQGAAIGGGLGLVAASDIAIATPDTKFGFTETRLGIVPGVISPYALRRLGMARCRRLFLTAEIFDGNAAHRWGLVDRLAEEAELDEIVDQQVEALRVAAPGAQAAAKRLLDEIEGLSVAEASLHTPRHIAQQRATDEAREGFAAFFEKRNPRWREEENS